jgi:hypothetical protein
MFFLSFNLPKIEINNIITFKNFDEYSLLFIEMIVEIQRKIGITRELTLID